MIRINREATFEVVMEMAALPSIADIAHRSKKRKREREALMSSYSHLIDVDFDSISEDTPTEAKESCFIAKYGLALVLRCKEMLKNLPDSLTDNQLRQVVTEMTPPNEKLKEVAFLLLDKFRCIHLLATFISWMNLRVCC